MARCINCGKRSLFLKVNSRSLCPECERIRIAEEAKREKERQIEEKRKKQEEARLIEEERLAAEKKLQEEELQKQKWYTAEGLDRDVCISEINKNPEKSFHDLMIPDKLGPAICIYRYWLVRVRPVNIELFYAVYCSGVQYSLLPTFSDDGCTFLSYKGFDVCELLDKQNMVSDWVSLGAPMICRISSCHRGKEGVAIAFFRDEEKRLQGTEKAIVRLSAYASESKQEAIAGCVDGQKLVCYEDDETGKVYVSNFFGNCVIGNLPAKYAKLYLEQGFAGIFFDHEEWDESKGKCIPFVKIYQ